MTLARTIEAARAYTRLGLHVFPVEVYQKGDGTYAKVPLTPNGYKDASDRLAKVIPMFRYARLRNDGDLAIGCCPGRGGYVVLDVDVKLTAQGREELDALIEKHGDFIEGAPEVITPSGGSHYWFGHPGGIVDNSNLSDSIEVRADNGFVVLPSGSPRDGYQWEISSPPLTETLPLPAYILDEIAARKTRARTPGENPAINTQGKVSHPGRVPFLFSIGSSLKYKGLPYDVIEAVLVVVNNMMCDPPQIDSEVRRAALDASRSNPVKPVPVAGGAGVDTWVDRIREVRGGRA